MIASQPSRLLAGAFEPLGDDPLRLLGVRGAHPRARLVQFRGKAEPSARACRTIRRRFGRRVESHLGAVQI
jgi:hypothetical protein